MVPNDNGWFITRYLVPSMYRGGYKDGIKTILEPIIDATDMPANLLAYYSFIKLKEGDLDSAKLYLQRAKNMGLTKKYLTRYEMDEDTFNEFESELKIIGEIPFDPSIAQTCESGKPYLSNPENLENNIWQKIITNISKFAEEKISENENKNRIGNLEIID